MQLATRTFGVHRLESMITQRYYELYFGTASVYSATSFPLAAYTKWVCVTSDTLSSFPYDSEQRIRRTTG